MTTVSALARLMPRPPARVDSRNTPYSAGAELNASMRAWRSEPAARTVHAAFRPSASATALLLTWDDSACTLGSQYKREFKTFAYNPCAGLRSNTEEVHGMV